MTGNAGKSHAEPLTSLGRSQKGSAMTSSGTPGNGHQTASSNGARSRFFTHRMSNGLQLLGEQMPDFESVAVAFHVRTGARDEPDPRVFGVSHFLEHMVF